MSTKTRHSERKFLTTSDVARLSRRSRAQVFNWWKAGLIPARNLNVSGKHLRFSDSPELRDWCEARRWNQDEWFMAVVEATREAIVARDYGEELIIQELRRELRSQLSGSDDPDKLVEKWEQETAEQRRDKLRSVARVAWERLRIEETQEIARQLLDSTAPIQLLLKWLRAIADQRPDDLPRVP
jgi:DNA primase